MLDGNNELVLYITKESTEYFCMHAAYIVVCKTSFVFRGTFEQENTGTPPLPLTIMLCF